MIHTDHRPRADPVLGPGIGGQVAGLFNGLLALALDQEADQIDRSNMLWGTFKVTSLESVSGLFEGLSDLILGDGFCIVIALGSWS